MTTITGEDLKTMGFKRYGWALYGITNTGSCTHHIVYNTLSENTEVRCLNDSISVEKCKSMDDISDLMRLFNIPSTKITTP